jgi:hypothetical protein
MTAEEYKELESLLDEYTDFRTTEPFIVNFINKLVEAEREACAKLMQKKGDEINVSGLDLGVHLAFCIRERGAP